MSNKVILVVLDGLNYQVARNCMGYLNGLLEHGHHDQKCAPRFTPCNVNSLQCRVHCMSAF